MVNPTSSVLSTGASDNLISSNSSNGSGTGSTDFADTLATCMFFGQTGSSQTGSPSGNAVQSGSAATAPATTLMNAAATPAAAAVPASTTDASAPASTTAGSTTAASTSASTSSASSPDTSPTPLTAAELANMTPDQAYWAEQPPAIQALQNMPDDQRYAYAQQLASQGYTIDVPIMVWGWDPLSTMIQRQNDGLTWTPSALQSDIPVAPGDSFPGLQSYDPNNPPAGSIQVTTAFAIGTNGQDPWVTQSELAASEALDS